MKAKKSLRSAKFVSAIVTLSMFISILPISSSAADKYNAEEYEIGSTENISITEDSQEIYYVFELEESGEVNATLKLESLDRYSYELYDDYGNTLYREQGADHTGEFNWVLTAGTYFIKFYKSWNASYGTFSFETTFISANVNHDENNSKKNNAATIDLNKTYNSIISANKNEEYFTFELEESGEINATLKLESLDRYSYELYDDYGNTLYHEQGADHTGEFNWVLTAGTYFIKFYKSWNASYGTFSFETTFISANVNHDENNSEKNDAADISLNKLYNSLISPNKSEEYFIFELNNSEEIYVTIDLGTLDRYSYELYDDYGNNLYHEQGTDHDDEFNWVLTAGTYYIKFYKSWNASYGTFSFKLSDGIKDTNNEDSSEETPRPDSDEDNNSHTITSKPDLDNDDNIPQITQNPDSDNNNNTDLPVVSNTYWDVNENDSYYVAISKLSSLGIIDGYDDGSFKPENKLTRAEFTKLVVGLLGKNNEAEYQNGNTGFYDVKPTHWASGYINVGVMYGIIEGYDVYTFGPEDNVTYAQTVKMLVEAAGYGLEAMKNGGWPSGYIATGDSLGITDGVSEDYNTYISRGEAAILMYNTLLIMQ